MRTHTGDKPYQCNVSDDYDLHSKRQVRIWRGNYGNLLSRISDKNFVKTAVFTKALISRIFGEAITQKKKEKKKEISVKSTPRSLLTFFVKTLI